MSATWQVGPSYSSFIHTTNSQYGAWSGGGYPVTSASNGVITRKIGGALVPNPPASRVSEVTAKDVAKIVSTGETISSATKEKFSDFMSKYGSGRITPLTSQYDRALAMHDAITPKRRLSLTPGNSPEPDTLSETGTSSTSPRKSFNDDAHSHASREHFNAMTSRPIKEGAFSGPTDFSFRRSPSYSDASSKVKDANNNNVLQISGYRSELIRPGLGRSNTFSGVPASFQETQVGSRYAETRVGLEKLFDDNRRESTSSSELRYGSPSTGNSVISLQGTSIPAPDDFRNAPSQRPQQTVSRDPARDYVRSRDLSGSEARDAGRNSIYWLYGSQTRSVADSGSHTTATTKSIPLTPYRPADYMLKSENIDYGSARHYGTTLLDVSRKDMNTGLAARDDSLLLQHNSYMDRGGYGSASSSASSIRSGSPYVGATDRHYDVLESGGIASGYDSADMMKVPELISRPTGTQKSILKKSSYGQVDAGNMFGGAAYGEAPNYRGARLGPHALKQLPPLSSFNMKRSNSGKKVTFNLAMNKCRAFLE